MPYFLNESADWGLDIKDLKGQLHHVSPQLPSDCSFAQACQMEQRVTGCMSATWLVSPSSARRRLGKKARKSEAWSSSILATQQVGCISAWIHDLLIDSDLCLLEYLVTCRLTGLDAMNWLQLNGCIGLQALCCPSRTRSMLSSCARRRA